LEDLLQIGLRRLFPCVRTEGLKLVA
jgi:hypothetical protein